VFIPRLSKESLLSRFDPESTARLRAVIDAALAKGRGAVVCSMHIGRPIAALYMHAALGYSCYRVRNGEVPPSLVRRFAAAESPSTNVSLINARDPACLLKAVRALRHNGLLFLMIDGRVFGRSGRGSLLGREVVTSVTGVELARITGAELLAGACCSTGPFRFRTRVDPVACAPDEAASRLLQMMETVVAEEPGQWFGVCRTSRMSVARSELD
jgi:lauroyl/myristoyl acyltransferase